MTTKNKQEELLQTIEEITQELTKYAKEQADVQISDTKLTRNAFILGVECFSTKLKDAIKSKTAE